MPRWGKAWDNAVEEYPWPMDVGGSAWQIRLADDLSRVIRAAVRAVVPGRQQGKNMADMMLKAERAAVRALKTASKRASG